MIKEDGAVGGAPTNNVGSGAIKGTGGAGGEPGVHPRHQPKKTKSIKNGLWECNPVMGDMLRRPIPVMETRRKGKFAGAVVFEVSSKIFHNLTMQKRKGKHWRTYLDEDDCYSEIREYANSHNGSIIVQNENTGEMRYVRYGRK